MCRRSRLSRYSLHTVVAGDWIDRGGAQTLVLDSDDEWLDVGDAEITRNGAVWLPRVDQMVRWFAPSSAARVFYGAWVHREQIKMFGSPVQYSCPFAVMMEYAHSLDNLTWSGTDWITLDDAWRKPMQQCSTNDDTPDPVSTSMPTTAAATASLINEITTKTGAW
jgi:hypothetical protein